MPAPDEIKKIPLSRLKKTESYCTFISRNLNGKEIAMSTGITETLFNAQTMMDTYQETLIAFGYDALDQLSAHIMLKEYQTILLVMGGESVHRCGAFHAFLQSPLFGKLDLNMPRFENVPPEPDTDCVRRIVACLDTEKPDAVIAVGGGSVMDAAKAAYLSWQTGMDIDRLFGREAATSAFPGRTFRRILAVPTTAGTGSEVTCYANIIDAGTGVKKLIADPAIIPELAAVEPMFTVSAPQNLTRVTAFDALVHAVESLLNFRGCEAHPAVVQWALQATRMIVSALPKVLRVPEDQEERAELSAAATLAGMAIRFSPTSLPHLLSFSFCGKAPHGAAVAALLPHFWKFYLREEPVRKQTMLLSGVFPGNTPEEVIGSYEKWIESCGGTVHPGELTGTGTEWIDKLAEDAAQNPVKLESAPRKIRADECRTVFHDVLDHVWTK